MERALPSRSFDLRVSLARRAAACDVQPLERRVLLSAGDLDPTFGGGDGKVRTNTAFPVRGIEALPAAGTGFVAAAGETGTFGVARFRGDGSLDTAFGGGDGLATTTFPATVRNPFAGAALPAPGGKVIAYGGGDTGPAGTPSRVILLARFNSDGSLDTAFSPGGAEGSGRAVLTHPVPHAPSTSDLAVAPDGGIILIGGTADEQTFVARIRPDGTPDTTFGGGRGYVTEQPFQYYDVEDDRMYPAQSDVVDVKVMPDGRILVLGDTSRAHPDPNYKVQHDLTLFRYLPDGRRDATFAGDGFTATDVYNRGEIADNYGGDVSFDFASTLALLPDGRILVGEMEDANAPRVLLYDANGGFINQLADRWTDGSSEVELPGVDAFAVFPDGRFVAAGAPNQRGFAILGYRADGSLDAAYLPPNGRDAATFGGGAQAFAAVARPDGKVDVAGLASTAAGGPARFALARFQGASAGDAITLAGGTLTVTGTGDKDSLFVEPFTDPATGRRQVAVNYGAVERFYDAAAVRRIVLDGGAGDDVLIVRKEVTAPATLRGGAGNDILGGGGGRDEFFGGSGVDTVTYSDRDNNLFISLDDVANDGGNRDENVHADIENVIGGSGNDTIVGNSAANRLEGGRGNDNLSGGGGNDVLLGGEGDDTLNDTSGSNTFDGGPGTDTINGVREGPPATGPVVYQAEAAQMSGAAVSSSSGGYTGSGFADFVNRSGDYVEWTVNVAEGGEQRLDFRYANGSSSGRTMTVSVDGQVVQGAMLFPPTGSWSTWKTSTIFPKMEPGTHRVRLFATGQSGPNVDALTVTPPAPARRLEAEDAARRGAVVGRSHAGYTGSGYVDFVNATGDYVEWTVEVQTAGTYTLGFRYANGSSARPMAMAVDGTNRGRPDFIGTGSWSTWKVQEVSVQLSAGTHRIRLATIGNNGPNVDSMTIRRT